MTRHHMSLYGYYRDTTPHLIARRQSLEVLTDTISPHSLTVNSLSQVLTAASFGDDDPAADPKQAFKRNLIRGLRRSGVKNLLAVESKRVRSVGQSGRVDWQTGRLFQVLPQVVRDHLP